MGDCGSYKGRVGVRYSTKTKEKNSREVCEELLRTRHLKTQYQDNEVTKEKVQDLLDKGIKFTLHYLDWNEWNQDDNPIEGFDEYDEKYGYYLNYARDVTIEDLEYIHLDKLPEDSDYIDISITETQWVLEAYGYIYYNGDNTETESKEVDSELTRLLSLPEATIVLECAGEGNY